MKQFHSFIDDDYPALSRTLDRTVINEHALLYEWTGSDPDLKPVVLTAHMDVVPVERDQWSAEPFDGHTLQSTERDGSSVGTVTSPEPVREVAGAFAATGAP